MRLRDTVQVKPYSLKAMITLFYCGGHSEYNLVAPIRQTASIFKQPVTVYKEHKSKVKAELKHVSREKPLQLFWTKRLSSISTVNVTEPDVTRRRITLPPSLK